MFINIAYLIEFIVDKNISNLIALRIIILKKLLSACKYLYQL